MSLSQLSAILALPPEELEQILGYAATLSPGEAADHFSALLGDSPPVFEFISAFNAQRQPRPQTPQPQQPPQQAAAQSYASATRPQETTATAATTASAAARPTGGGGKRAKKKANLHVPQPRRVEDAAGSGTAYVKKSLDDEDYIPRKPSPAPASAAKPSSTVAVAQQPQPQQPQPAPAPKSAAASSQGYLISDVPVRKQTPKSGTWSSTPSRSATPKPAGAAKATHTTTAAASATAASAGGTVVSDLDAAIRALEMSTNPTLAADAALRRCDCAATRHPLQRAAPNCLRCGKVICVREGLGPCTFCHAGLLTAAEVQALVGELRAERSRELVAADREANRRADMARAPAPYSRPRTGPGVELGPTPAEEAKAAATLGNRDKQAPGRHRPQAESAHDAAAAAAPAAAPVAAPAPSLANSASSDLDVTAALTGQTNLWWSVEERARELKRQQELLRNMEWDGKDEWEKRRPVISIDLTRGKVVRQMARVERPPGLARPATPPRDVGEGPGGGGGKEIGGLVENPLLGGLIRPTWPAMDVPQGQVAGRVVSGTERSGWRRVQNDEEGPAHAVG